MNEIVPEGPADDELEPDAVLLEPLLQAATATARQATADTAARRM
jgi:hypothetical protein